MIQALIVLVVATAVLVWSANGLARSAQNMAQLFGVSPMLIGFTVVAFGTSAPELATSMVAALRGNPGVAVGNGIGSNLVNTGVVLGLTLIGAPILVTRGVLRRELPLLALATILTGYLFWDNNFSTAEGWLLLMLLVPVLWCLVLWSADSSHGKKATVSANQIYRVFSVFLLTLLLLLVSAHQLVNAAIFLAHYWGVSELLIGMILVAIGTSLPELAVCIAAMARRAGAMALGGILGSNIFNIFAVLGLAGALSSGYTHPDLLTRIYTPLAILTAVFFALIYLVDWRIGDNTGVYIGRLTGVTLICAYIGCMMVLVA